jgi:hypothetical protein
MRSMPAFLFTTRRYYESMETRPAFTIEKPSFWKSRREILDASHGKAGFLQTTSMWKTTAEGEAHGRKFRFTPRGWDQRKAEMTDMSGQVVGRLEPSGWWGMRFKMVYGGTEYEWKPNGWGTRFTIRQGEKEVMNVRPGGYFKPGMITISSDIAEKDALPLALFGLFQMELYAAHSSAASSGAVTAAT